MPNKSEDINQRILEIVSVLAQQMDAINQKLSKVIDLLEVEASYGSSVLNFDQSDIEIAKDDLLMLPAHLQRVALVFSQNPDRHLVVSEIQAIIGRHQSQVSRLLNELIRFGLILRRKGDTKKGERAKAFYYYLTPQKRSLASDETKDLLMSRIEEISDEDFN